MNVCRIIKSMFSALVVTSVFSCAPENFRSQSDPKQKGGLKNTTHSAYEYAFQYEDDYGYSYNPDEDLALPDAEDYELPTRTVYDLTEEDHIDEERHEKKPIDARDENDAVRPTISEEQIHTTPVEESPALNDSSAPSNSRVDNPSETNTTTLPPHDQNSNSSTEHKDENDSRTNNPNSDKNPEPAKDNASSEQGTNTPDNTSRTEIPTFPKENETHSTDVSNFKWVSTMTAQMSPLSWDNKEKRTKWSSYIYEVISKEEPELLTNNIAQDMTTFCPKFNSLSPIEKLNFWGEFISALSKKESSWDPTTHFVEKTMGIDPITGKQIASEGLLQLSYQDQKNYKIDCGFNWSKDKHLADRDPKKTIMNPYLNLRCGIKILSHQLVKKKSIVLEKGVYWAVLKKEGKYNRVPYIAGKTKSLKFCR